MNAPVPNFIPEVEQEVLGVLLSGGDFRRVRGILQGKHFVEPMHRALFDVIQTGFERYNSTSVPVIAKLIPDDMAMAFKVRHGPINAYLARLVADTVQGASALEANARKIVEQWARIAISEEAGRLQAAANDTAANPRELVTNFGQTFDDIMSEVRAGPRRKSRMAISEAATNAIGAAREARQRGSGLTGVTWGLTEINRLTGGIQKRDLTLIAARPSMGKSTVGLSVALRAAKAGHGVGFISLEMDSDKLAARAIADLAFDWSVKVPYADIIRGSVSDDDLEQIRIAAKDVERMPLWIEDQSGLSMTDIRVKAEAMMQQAELAGFPLETLIVDHIGLIRPSSRYQGNRTNEVAEISSGLKAMAREYGIGIIALSQLNRAVEGRNDKRPQLSDLRDSGAIEQDADTIIFLYREAYYLEREKGGGMEAEAERLDRLVECRNTLEFSIAKQRNGPIKTVDLFVEMACSAVRNGARS